MQPKEITELSIFGEYKQTENRVTVALLHILKQGDKDLIAYLLSHADKYLPDNEIHVYTQTKNNEYSSVPDGILSCNFSFQIIIESKIVTNSIKETQLNSHIQQATTANAFLMYLTPDPIRPAILNNKDIIWFNWQAISDILRKYASDYLSGDKTNDICSYLINQFTILLENLHLTEDATNRVIVVGGAFGEEVACKYLFYACQNRRNFKPAKYLAFAHQNRIKYLFEIIDGPHNNIDIADVVSHEYFDEFEPEYKKIKREYFKLRMIHEFTPAIQNNTTDRNGRRCAFTQGQRYVSYDSIIKAQYTSELVAY